MGVRMDLLDFAVPDWRKEGIVPIVPESGFGV